MLLTGVAHVGVALEIQTLGGNAVGGEFRRRGHGHLVEHRANRGGLGLVQALQPGLNVVAPQIGQQHAPGRERVRVSYGIDSSGFVH